MGFQRVDRTAYPPRHWALRGYANAGKSTFLSAMRQPLLMIDADGRAAEIARRGAEVLLISKETRDHHTPSAILQIVRREDLSAIGTVCVDSMTSILQASVGMGLANNRANVVKNKASSWINKANDMRLLQSALKETGKDFAIIWHLEDGRDKNGNPCQNQTMPLTERKRIKQSLNAVIEIGRYRNGMRYAKVAWSRVGLSGIVIEDTAGYWAGVPERIEQALYDPVPDAVATYPTTGTDPAVFHQEAP